MPLGVVAPAMMASIVIGDMKNKPNLNALKPKEYLLRGKLLAQARAGNKRAVKRLWEEYRCRLLPC